MESLKEELKQNQSLSNKRKSYEQSIQFLRRQQADLESELEGKVELSTKSIRLQGAVERIKRDIRNLDEDNEPNQTIDGNTAVGDTTILCCPCIPPLNSCWIGLVRLFGYKH